MNIHRNPDKRPGPDNSGDPADGRPGGTAPHRTPLGRTGWQLWRDATLASAGFPARQVMALCDDDLAAAADSLGGGSEAARERYEASYARATQRLSAAISAAAAEPRFREAVTWQEPTLLTTCLDRAATGLRGRRQRRRHEPVIAWHLQRYCLSNETQGFFGPVGWARVGRDATGLTVTPGPGPLTRRTSYFEWRAIDALAGAIASRPEVRPWLRPRVAPSAVLDRDLLRLPFRPPVTLAGGDARMLRLCDGTRTVRSLTGHPADAGALGTLLRLRELGAVQLGLHIPVSSWPERDLVRMIGAIPDPLVRGRALEQLAGLVAARAAVSDAAGDAARLYRATTAATEVFRQVTGVRAERCAPTGGPLVYEEAVRDTEIYVGRHLTDMLAGPLGLLLDSAAWLVNGVAAEYRALFLRVVSQARGGNGTKGVPLLPAAAGVMPELFRPSSGLEPAPVAGVVAEFQKRWCRILGVPPGARRHQVAAAAIAGQVAQEFATGPPAWSGAKVHSADVMIAAPDPEAVTRGAGQLVLGALHPAANTLENRVYSAQHPAPGRLLSAAEADHLDRRIYAIPARDSPVVTSRLAPPSALLSPRYTYLCLGAESVVPPDGAQVLPAADLTVEARGSDLIARRGRDGPEYDFGEVIGDMLAALVGPAFRPLAEASHLPRISIDAMVISRESWMFPAAGTTWAFVRDESRRYAAARQWRTAHGLPERAFASLPGEAGPAAVDFRSPPLVGLLAQLVRRAAKRGQESFTLTEMLPDVDQLWLKDAGGDRYTAELKLVAVDSRVP